MSFGLRCLDGVGETIDATIHHNEKIEELMTAELPSSTEKIMTMEKESTNTCCCSHETNWIKMGLAFLFGAVAGHIVSESIYKNGKKSKED